MNTVKPNGSFPIFRNEVDTPLLQHPQVPLQTVRTETGVALTAPLRADGTSFNLYNLYNKPKSPNNKIHMTKVYYVDPEHNVQSLDIPNSSPVVLDSQGAKELVIGYVSKINNLRWGFNVYINVNTGMSRIEVDHESPIIGVELKLI